MPREGMAREEVQGRMAMEYVVGIPVIELFLSMGRVSRFRIKLSTHFSAQFRR